MTDIKVFEHLTLKVPYEILNKKFRLAQKSIDREVSHANQATTDLEKAIQTPETGQGSTTGPTYAEVEPLLVKLRDYIERLKLRAGQAVGAETEAAAQLKQRLDHLQAGVAEDAYSTATLEQWRKLRLDRMLIDYFLRSAYHKTSRQLADQLELTYMSNIALFQSALEVEDSLKRHETGPCLEWCMDNKSKLRRLKSNFELSVRVQEYVEMIRECKCLEATKYAQKYFGPLEKEQWSASQLLSYMGLLAYPPETKVLPYCQLYSPERWDDLILAFHHENLRVYQLHVQSVFSSCLQTGLCALKTPQCYAESADKLGSEDFEDDPMSSSEGAGSLVDLASPNSVVSLSSLSTSPQKKARDCCPVCVPAARDLASNLPFAHAAQSRLVCPYSGEILNEHNPPLMLPNGMVYGQNTLFTLASSNPDGSIVCPRTKLTYSLRHAEKVFVM